MQETKLPFTSPEQIRDSLIIVQDFCSEAGEVGKDGVKALIANTQIRSLLVTELREKSKWDKRFKSNLQKADEADKELPI